ncbi:MAG: hypothetical protein IPP47_18695 [Bryobacterales bacterium]|nr:hypothetical protein [Bryobacterales bacterium]
MPIEAVHAVLLGETWMAPKYSPGIQEPATAEATQHLRFKERDRPVLRGVFEGSANEELAELTAGSKTTNATAAK